MKRLDNESLYNRYLDYIGQRKKFTNLYLKPNDVDKAIMEKRMYGYEGSDYLIIIYNLDDVKWLYYFADNWEWISDIKNIKDKDTIFYVSLVVNDVIEKMSDYEIWTSEFEVKKRYVRMRMGNECITSTSLCDASYACSDDAYEVYQLFNNNFDVIGDKIMSLEEISQAIEENRILLIREDCIKGYIIFEDKGKTTYVRNICSAPNSRGKGIGRKLMVDYLSVHSNYKSFTLWCRYDNTVAKSLYESLGYKEERVNNYIFII